MLNEAEVYKLPFAGLWNIRLSSVICERTSWKHPFFGEAPLNPGNLFSSSSRNEWLQAARWDWRWQNFRQDFFLDVACVPIVYLLSIGSAWGLHSPWNLAASIAKTLREFDKGTLPVWLTSSCDFSWQEFLLDLFRTKIGHRKIVHKCFLGMWMALAWGSYWLKLITGDLKWPLCIDRSQIIRVSCRKH